TGAAVDDVAAAGAVVDDVAEVGAAQAAAATARQTVIAILAGFARTSPIEGLPVFDRAVCFMVNPSSCRLTCLDEVMLPKAIRAAS
ncbi:MAG TPA: hypothetical protein VIA81_06895, partial [Acidimicrobiia bacterium]